MARTLRIALAQFDFPVGAVALNTQRIKAMLAEARDVHGAAVPPPRCPSTRRHTHLMQLGALGTVAARKQKNLTVVILDNGAYQITGGSNLDLADEVWDSQGRQLSLEKDIYPVYDLILCVSTFSATAPSARSSVSL